MCRTFNKVLWTVKNSWSVIRQKDYLPSRFIRKIMIQKMNQKENRTALKTSFLCPPRSLIRWDRVVVADHLHICGICFSLNKKLAEFLRQVLSLLNEPWFWSLSKTPAVIISLDSGNKRIPQTCGPRLSLTDYLSFSRW